MIRISVNEEPSDHENYIAEVPDSLSENLSDLFLISHDILEAATNARHFLLKEKSLQETFEIEDTGLWKVDFADTEINPGANQNIQSNVWESALTKYARCFSSSKRFKLKKEEIFFEEKKTEAHDFFY